MKEHSPSAERNKTEMQAALMAALPTTGTILEIASGSGQHAIHFAALLPKVTWQPSDQDEKALASIPAWTAEAGLKNVQAPLTIDVMSDDWGIAAADAIVNINMLHISPWDSCEALFTGAARLLSTGAPMFCYGPYIRAEHPTAPSNLEFDAWLKSRDSRWGLRQLEEVVEVAAGCGLELELVSELPNNNCGVVFRRG
ncbi:MAG: cyclopropane fatty-acyl-phospholipid synthase-like methyltransferase [Planctomycetota bacterium]|jgi:cyclopropane fatty-acyl-phospholipid synthase-like methyltransferase